MKNIIISFAAVICMFFAVSSANASENYIQLGKIDYCGSTILVIEKNLKYQVITISDSRVIERVDMEKTYIGAKLSKPFEVGCSKEAKDITITRVSIDNYNNRISYHLNNGKVIERKIVRRG